MPNLLTSVGSSLITANEHLLPLAFLLVGNQHCEVITRDPWKGEVPGGRGGLLHEMDRSRSISVHSREADALVSME